MPSSIKTISFKILKISAITIGSIIAFAVTFMHAKYELLIFAGALLIGAIVIYFNAKKTNVFVVINELGLKLEHEKFINWYDVIDVYVKHKDEDESITYSLFVYHVNDETEEFLVTDYTFERKGMSYDDICFFIQYWINKKA